MRIKSWAALAGVLTAIALTGCGGGGDNAPISASCQTQSDLPVSNFSYPDGTPLRTGTNVDLSPALQVVPGRTLDNAALHFELVSGSLPTGLTLDPNTGRISGNVQGPADTSFPVTVRLSAACSPNTITTSAIFTVT